MVKTTTNNSQRDCDQGDIKHDPRFCATGHHTPVGEGEADEDTREDAKGVGVDREVEGCPIRAEVSQELPDIEDLP